MVSEEEGREEPEGDLRRCGGDWGGGKAGGRWGTQPAQLTISAVLPVLQYYDIII